MAKSILDQLIDESPRRVYSFLRRRLLSRAPLTKFDPEHPCVFVLSTGRVGTETLAALFGLANNVLSYHEPAPKLYNLSKLAYEFTGSPIPDRILCEAVMTTRRDLLAYSLDCNRGYVETSPQATFLAPLISTIIPEVRFIYLVRDPREVVRSGMRRRWFNGNPADGTRISPLMDSPIRREWETYTAFQKNLWLWAESNRWILRFLSSFPQERQLFLRSEDVFSADKDVLASLFTFIHASLPPITKVNRLLDQKLNAQQSGEFPDVSAWTREMYKDLIKIAGEVAGVLGYDLHSGSQTG